MVNFNGTGDNNHMIEYHILYLRDRSGHQTNTKYRRIMITIIPHSPSSQ